MSGRPAEPIPTWSEDGLFPAGSDPWSGTATASPAPSFAERKAGHVPNAQQPAQYENNIKRSAGRWIDFLADVGFMNWGQRLAKDSAAGSLTLSYNGTSGCGAQNFWSDYHNAWIVCGQNTNGKFFVGDANLLEPFTIGAVKYAFGVAANNGNLVLVSGDIGATIAYNLIPGTIASGGPATFPGTSGVSFATSAMRLASGTLLVVGSEDGVNHISVWRSTNSGTTFAKITVATPALFNNPRIVERAGQILIYDKNRIINQPLYVSTDDGQTWALSALPFAMNTVESIWYSSEEDRYTVMGSQDRLWVAGPDLVFTDRTFVTGGLVLGATDPQAIGVSGSAILLFTDDGANRRRIFMSWDLGLHWRQIGRSTYPGAPRIAVNPYGQFFTSSVLDVQQTLQCSGVGATARGE